MKILILIDAWFPFTGGAQIQIKNLKRVLEKKYNCKYYILHSPSANIFFRFLWSIWVIPQAILFYKKRKFDLIHAHAYWPGIPGKIISKILGLPIVFTVHGSNLMDLGKKSVRAWFERYILTKIKYTKVISVSSSFLEHGNVNKNIVVIPNGVNVKLFDSIKIQHSSAIDHQPLTIIFVGRDDPVKGLKYLKKAMKRVRREFPKTQLKIIKSGYSRKALIKEYKGSNLFVLPSISEGQPLTLLEAWAAKLPVVATNVGDNAKMVKNGVNGYLVEPKDIKGLAGAIIKVFRNYKKAQKMGERGYKLVKNKYSWEQTADKTWKVYQALLDTNFLD